MTDKFQRSTYSEKIRSTCPRCDSDKVAALPAINPGSQQAWFKCDGCDHLWSQYRDGGEPGNQRSPSDPPEGQGAVS